MSRFVAMAMFCLLLVLFPGSALISRGEKADELGRHVEEAGGFSYVPPEGWKVLDYPGSKYKLAFGPVKNGFASNINIVDEVNLALLNSYVNANIEAIKQAFKDVKILSKTDFKTTAGLAGAAVVIENEQNEMLLRQTFYFFGNPQKKYVVTCTTLAEGGDTLDPVFAETLKTFRFEKR